MSIVTLNNISRSFGAQDVLLPVSLEIEPGARIGLVGRNGVGKTTLLRIICGQELPSTGHVSLGDGVRVGLLEQDPRYPEGRTLYEEVREGLAALEDLEERLRSLEGQLADEELQRDEGAYQRVLDRYAAAQEAFEGRGGYQADARVEATLDGLGVPRRDWHREAATFSGGERNIIGLARLLVADPDLMLLDEPGNHLDFEGLDWLEDELKRFRGAVVLVSHNRYLLDSVTRTTWELERGAVNSFSGNYSAYRAEKLLQMEKSLAEEKRARREADRLNFQIQRLKSWASVYDNPKLARTAKRFEKRVEELQQVKARTEDTRRIGLRLEGERTRGDIALEVVDYTRRFGEEEPALLEDVSFRMDQGEAVGLVGPNGSGKSTLLKDIVRWARWENETLRLGRLMKLGYLSQMGAELEVKNTLLEEMLRLSGLRRNEAEALAHRFLFTRDDLEKPVAVLSGGERVRLQLAALMAGRDNFLVLDEPTNHLDVFSREAVEDALEAFQGTLLVVSHDRYFLDKIAERILYLDKGSVESFDGNFSQFWERWKQRRAEEKERDAERERERRSRDRERRAARLKRVKWNPERFAELEGEIERLEEQQERLQGELEKEIEKGNAKREAAKREALRRTRDNLEEVYEEWFAMGDRKQELP